MGCKCCKGKEEIKNEMIDGNLPEIDFKGEINELEDGIKLKGQKNNKNYEYTDESDCISTEQNRNEEIFDFFNDLRNDPQRFLAEAENYNLKDLISSAKERIVSDNMNNLIKNPFFNLFLDTCVKKTPFSKEDILNNIETNEQLKNYKKDLYFVETSLEKPIDSVWYLLSENKDKALDEILFKKMDYLLISTLYIPDKKVLMVYFLFLKKSFKK